MRVFARVELDGTRWLGSLLTMSLLALSSCSGRSQSQSGSGGGHGGAAGGGGAGGSGGCANLLPIDYVACTGEFADPDFLTHNCQELFTQGECLQACSPASEAYNCVYVISDGSTDCQANAAPSCEGDCTKACTCPQDCFHTCDGWCAAACADHPNDKRCPDTCAALCALDCSTSASSSCHAACATACAAIANLDCWSQEIAGCASESACQLCGSAPDYKSVLYCGGRLLHPSDKNACITSLKSAGVKVL